MASCHLQQLPGVRFEGGVNGSTQFWLLSLKSVFWESSLPRITASTLTLRWTSHLATEGPGSRLPSPLHPRRVSQKGRKRNWVWPRRAVISDRRVPFTLERNQPRRHVDSRFPASKAVKRYVLLLKPSDPGLLRRPRQQIHSPTAARTPWLVSSDYCISSGPPRCPAEDAHGPEVVDNSLMVLGSPLTVL